MMSEAVDEWPLLSRFALPGLVAKVEALSSCAVGGEGLNSIAGVTCPFP